MKYKSTTQRDGSYKPVPSSRRPRKYMQKYIPLCMDASKNLEYQALDEFINRIEIDNRSLINAIQKERCELKEARIRDQL